MPTATTTEEEIRSFVLENYGLETESVRRLGGYENDNYEVAVAGAKYVFKKYRDEPGLMGLLGAENSVLQLLDRNLRGRFPCPVPNRNGEYISHGKDGRPARLLTYVDGMFFEETRPTVRKHESFGRFLAEMDLALTGLRLPAIESRELDWDIQHFRSNRKYLEFIPAARDRSLIEYFLLQYEEVVEPLLPALRKSLIHADAHCSNVLVDDAEVTGLIDFGDLSYSFLINELAVAITYVMFEKDEPLGSAGELLRGYHSVLPLEEDEIGLLYYLVGARLCISVCHSAEAKIRKPGDEYVVESEAGAWKLLRKWVGLNPLRAEDEWRKAAGLDSKLKDTTRQDLLRRHDHTSRALSVTFEEPVKMQSAAFQYMFDSLGNSYLDCYNNIPQVGHCHPKVVRAGRRAMARLNTNTRYLNDAYNEFAENLLKKFPEPLNKVFFVNSGSAASDLAIRLAAAHTGRKGVMVMEHGYHGNTRLGIDISHYKYNRKGGAGRPEGVIEAPVPDVYKGKYSGADAADLYARDAISMLEDFEPAAFIAEPIVGCGGQVPLAEGYLKRIYPAVRERGGVCISDEVQTGFGRLGRHFWGFEMHGVEPDIVVLGKPMGNGHPIAAVVTTDEIARSFETGMEFFSSFGGNTVSMAIGQAVLDVLEEEALPENAEAVGAYLLERLKEIVEKHENAGDARGAGLFLGLELVLDKKSKEPATELASRVKETLKEKGILVGTDGPDVNVIKIKPPICFTREDADRLAVAIEDTLINL